MSGVPVPNALPYYTRPPRGYPDAQSVLLMWYFPPSLVWTNFPLPADEQQWMTFSKSGQVDYKACCYLEWQKIINWCPTLTPLYPITTTADGNCLMNAVALCLFTNNAPSGPLRMAVYENMAACAIRLSLRERWQIERTWQNSNVPDGGLFYTDDEWDREWNRVVQEAAYVRQKVNPYNNDLYFEYLEPIHIFVLANALRRSIIVLGESFAHARDGSKLEQNNIIGIYLPLHWTPDSCYRFPVIIGFMTDHFFPLLSRGYIPQQGKASTTKYAVPLVNANLEPHRIHFLLPEEESVAHILLQQYLYITEEEMKGQESTEMVLCALTGYDSYGSDAALMDTLRDVLSYSQDGHQNAIGPHPASSNLPYQQQQQQLSTELKQKQGNVCSYEGCKRAVMTPHQRLAATRKYKTPVYCREPSLLYDPYGTGNGAVNCRPLCDFHASASRLSSKDNQLARVEHAKDVDQPSAMDSLSTESTTDRAVSQKFYVIIISPPSYKASAAPALTEDGQPVTERLTIEEISDSDTVPSGDDTQNAPQSVEMSTVKSIRNNDDGDDHNEGGRPSSEIDELYEKPCRLSLEEQPETESLLTEPKKIVKNDICVGPSCNNFGLVQLRGLCMACYQTLLNANFESRYGGAPV